MTTVELRNVPVQARSQARLQQITDAARTAAATIGYERFTTADVAELAGCSIGTVYRYVPDRVALLDLIDPDRYVFTEARAVKLDADEPLDVVVMEGLLNVSSTIAFGMSDQEPDRIDERALFVHLIAALQQKVVAIDAARAAQS